MNEFEPVLKELLRLIAEWEPRLASLSHDVITQRKNSQNRSIRQILGHLVDSASNNTHRMIHLQYQESPLRFPNYASNGNNDRWIAIQNYQAEDWNNIIKLWKYLNYHIIHVIRNVDESKLENKWFYSEERLISLRDSIPDYLKHFKLHLDEIRELMDQN